MTIQEIMNQVKVIKEDYENNVIRYKDYYYYASGPSLEKDIQHALQWRIIQYVASQNGKAYELGWTDKQKDDPIGFFKRGFTNKHSHVDCLTGVITQ